ncbi:hypothetical protein [Hanstruepera marina]|uniref:hypothetical protein n=1 Tax=Hanstruepera marina TaxID=2873265 RepID=UPI001CA74F1B|nr:hypothetical protein [Hanstruepera marina]
MQLRFTWVFLLFSISGFTQYAVKNYSNATIDQLPTVKQIADWIQFHDTNNVIPLLSDPSIIDQTFLNIESSYLSIEYSRDKIEFNEHKAIEDKRNIVWYERNFYKVSKSKLKPRYQIYITVEFFEGSYRVIDLSLGKNKKINTSQYDKN